MGASGASEIKTMTCTITRRGRRFNLKNIRGIMLYNMSETRKLVVGGMGLLTILQPNETIQFGHRGPVALQVKSVESGRVPFRLTVAS